MRWTGRFFLRNKALCALFAGMVIIPSGATVYFGILKMSGFELLYNLVRIQYIIDLVWVSMTAFFMSRAEANDLRDCIDVSTGKCFFYEREALKWILLLWGVWNIIAIVTLLIGSYRNDAIFALSANWFLRGYLMNIALPQLICILAAAAFVRASHKIAAGFLLIFDQPISRTDCVDTGRGASDCSGVECVSAALSYFVSEWRVGSGCAVWITDRVVSITD